jgi:type I restriction enzyme, S subunit
MSDLPDGWSELPLAEICKVSYGKALDKAARSSTGTFHYVGSGGSIARTDDRLVHYETIVVGRKGTAGSVQRYRNGCWPSDTTFYLEVPVELDGRLIEHQLRAAQLGQHDRSTALPGLGRPDLERTGIRVPPRPEQERIVTAIEEAFSKLDAGEAALRATRQRLKRLRESVLAAAVTGRLVPQDPTDEPASKLLGHLGVGPATPPDSVLPSSWALATLGSLLERIEAGKSFATGGRPARDDEFGVIKVSAMTWGAFRPSQNKALPAGIEIEDRWLIRRNDLLFSRANTANYVGAVVLVEAEHSRLILSDKSLRLVVRAGVEPSWILHVLRSGPVRKAIESLATGTKESMRNISQEKLRTLRIPLPPTAEQNRIVNELDRQFSFIDACERAVDAGLARSTALRRSTLKAAFKGKLVPQDPSDEPASALLDRLRAERLAGQSPTKVRQRANSVSLR